MNNKRNTRALRITLNGLTLISFLSGCNTPSEPLTAKESRMNKELLRSQVLKYKAEVEAEIEKMYKLSEKHHSFNDTPFSPEVAASTKKAILMLLIEHDSYKKYLLFYEKLKEKGGNMNGLEIESKHFSPPPDKYQGPIPDSKIMADE